MATDVVELIESLDRLRSAPKVGVSGAGEARGCDGEMGDTWPMSGEESGSESGIPGPGTSDVVEPMLRRFPRGVVGDRGTMGDEGCAADKVDESGVAAC